MNKSMLPMQRTLLWRRVDQFGVEHFTLLRTAQGWQLAGTVIVSLDRQPVRVNYVIVCDEAWRTRTVNVHQWAGDALRVLNIRVDEPKRWWSGDQELMDVRGCVDIDLGITPSTNTLPIRRLGLSVGQSAEVTAAWVRFPQLTIAPLPQRYTRQSESGYRYESRSFATEIEVDELGVARRYAGVWEREAVSE